MGDSEMHEPDSRPWGVLPSEKGRRLFEVAVVEFANRGYTAASMTAVVRTAGISKGLLFHYYRSKAELFNGIVSVAIARAQDVLRAERAVTIGQPLPVRLVRLLQAGFRYLDDHPQLARIYFRLLQSGDGPLGRQQVEAITRHAREFLLGLVEEAQAAGELDAQLDAERTAWFLEVVYRQLLSAGLDHDDRPAWTAAFRQLVHGAFGSAAATAAHDG